MFLNKKRDVIQIFFIIMLVYGCMCESHTLQLCSYLWPCGFQNMVHGKHQLDSQNIHYNKLHIPLTQKGVCIETL